MWWSLLSLLCSSTLLVYPLLLTYFQRISCPWCRFRSISSLLVLSFSQALKAILERKKGKVRGTADWEVIICLPKRVRRPKICRSIPPSSLFAAIESISLMVWRFRKTIPFPRIALDIDFSLGSRLRRKGSQENSEPFSATLRPSKGRKMALKPLFVHIVLLCKVDNWHTKDKIRPCQVVVVFWSSSTRNCQGMTLLLHAAKICFILLRMLLLFLHYHTYRAS